MTEEQIIHFITGKNGKSVWPREGEKMTSIWRSNDKEPTCYFFRKNGYLRWADFADPLRHNSNCYDLVSVEYFGHKCENKEDYRKVIDILEQNDLGVADIPDFEPFDFHLMWEEIPWTEEGLADWAQYGIEPDHYVAQIGEYSFNTRTYPKKLFTKRPVLPTYVLKFGGRGKIYCMQEKFFLSSCLQTDIWKYIEGNESIIITKSYKDAKVVSNKGYDVMGVQGESMWKLNWDLTGYKKIYIIFDHDKTGIHQSLLCKEYLGTCGYNNVEIVSFDPFVMYKLQAKDIADIRLKGGESILNQMLCL